MSLLSDRLRNSSSMIGLGSSIFSVAFPIMIGMLGRSLQLLIDNLFVGHLEKPEVAVAGVAMASLIWMLAFRLELGIGIALNSLLAQAIGRGDKADISRLFYVGLMITVLLASILSLSFSLGIGWFLKMLEVPRAVISVSETYFRTLAPFMIPSFAIYTTYSYYKALGRSDITMWLDLAAIPLNVLLDYALIFGRLGFPKLGVAGAAIGTGISIIFKLALFTAMLTLRRIPFPQLTPIAFKPKVLLKTAAEIVKLALPASLEGLVVSLSQFIIVRLLSDLGAVGLGAYRLTIRFQGVLILIAVGFSVGTTTVVGQLIGMRRLKQAKLAGWYGSLLSLLLGLAIGVVLWVFAPQLGRLITNSKELAMEISRSIRLILPAVLLFDFINPLMGSLKGSKDTLSPFMLTLISRLGFRVPLIYLLRRFLHLGLEAVWMVFIIDNVLRAGIAIWLWYNKDLSQESSMNPKKAAVAA